MSDPEISQRQLERLNFIARLSLLLNSSLDTRRVITVALKHLQNMLNAEAGTVFSIEPGANELSFWALQGGQEDLLNRKIPLGKGIVGWVVSKKTPLHVKDVQSDPRFFNAVDQEGGFKTREILCVPLIARGEKLLGALQILNPAAGSHFADDDLFFLEQCAQQLSISLENARLYETLSEQHMKLETLERRKGELVSIISHEFRTPLNIIRTATELMMGSIDEKDEGLRKRISESLLSGVDRLSRIIGEITNLSLIQRGSISLSNENIDAASFLKEVTRQFLKAAESRHLTLNCDTGDCSECVHGDKMLLAIVLSNFIRNAIRFTPDGGSISTVCRRHTGMMEFSVSDTGIGIAAGEIPLIFEKFYEIVPAGNHSSGDLGFKSCGLGLGLPTAASILEAHGSKIQVESIPEKGSTFSFLLPLVENPA